jgi:hypothetical protein
MLWAMVIVLRISPSLSRNHSFTLLLLVVARMNSFSKPSLPPANKMKKSSSKSSLLAANGGGSAHSVLSKHAAKYVKSSLKSSSPAANGGQSAGDMTTVSVVSLIQSKSNTIKSNLVNLKCVAINWLNQDALLKEFANMSSSMLMFH